jgi:hypothetical protein
VLSSLVAPVEARRVLPESPLTSPPGGVRVVGWGRGAEGAAAVMEFPVVVNDVPPGTPASKLNPKPETRNPKPETTCRRVLQLAN